jgi:ribonuclease D
MTRTTLKKSVEAADHPILLESSAQLVEAKKSWNGNGFLGIDTEFVRERTYRADLGLVQVSDGVTAWLIDPLKLDTLDTLRELLEEPGITKILHSGSEDLEVLSHTVGAPPAPLVDTQVACAMLGQPLQMGYHATVQWLFDIEVDKEQTRSNWCRRPLTDRQLHYAAMDVVLLPAIAEALLPRLEDAGRLSWMEEDVARALQNAKKEVRPEFAYLRISGVGRLNGEALRAVRALAAWRETTAQRKNLARGFIVSDAGLLNLARSRPAGLRQARDLEGIHPKALGRYAKTFIRLLESAAEDRSPIQRPEPLDAAQRKQINAMRTVVQDKAAQLGVDPALLASRREMENLLRSVTAGDAPPERFTGWRQAVITDDLLAIIR